MGPAVEGRVLHALSGHGSAHLLEADDGLGALRGLRQALGPDWLAQEDGDHQVEGLALVRLEALTGALGIGMQDGGGLRAGRRSRDDVDSVLVGGHQQLDDTGPQIAQRVVAQTHVLGRQGVQNTGQTVDFRGQRPGDHLALGLLDDAVVVHRCIAGELLHERTQPGGTGGIHLELVDPPGGVIAGGPGHRPGGGQGLTGGEDLLRRDPRPPGGLGQLGEVAARVGQTIGMVHSQGADDPCPHEFQDEAMAACEDVGVLDPDRGQRADVEETSVVDLLIADLPVGQPVVLALDEYVHRQGLGALGDGEGMVVVAQHPLLAQLLLAGHHHLLQGELFVGQDGADAPAQDRHEDGLVQGEIEPGCVGGVRTLAQHRPQGQVVPAGSGHRHVVGNDVHHDAHPTGTGRSGQGLQSGASAHDGADPAMVDDVVAVGGARCGRQDRGEVEVSNPEVGQVRDQFLDVGEGEIRSQLETIGGHRGTVLRGRHVPRPGGVGGGFRRVHGNRRSGPIR